MQPSRALVLPIAAFIGHLLFGCSSGSVAHGHSSDDDNSHTNNSNPGSANAALVVKDFGYAGGADANGQILGVMSVHMYNGQSGLAMGAGIELLSVVLSDGTIAPASWDDTQWLDNEECVNDVTLEPGISKDCMFGFMLNLNTPPKSVRLAKGSGGYYSASLPAPSHCDYVEFFAINDVDGCSSCMMSTCGIDSLTEHEETCSSTEVDCLTQITSIQACSGDNVCDLTLTCQTYVEAREKSTYECLLGQGTSSECYDACEGSPSQ